MKKAIAVVSAISIMASTMGMASAVTLDEIGKNDVISDSVIRSQDVSGKLIELEAGEPVSIIHSDGTYDIFTYEVKSTRSAADRVKVTRQIQKLLWSANMTLWADGRWENREVTIEDIGKSFGGTNIRYENAEEWITKETGSNNTMAKARATGDIVWYLVSTGSPAGTESYDFEIHLDPANSGKAYLSVNDDL